MHCGQISDPSVQNFRRKSSTKNKEITAGKTYTQRRCYATLRGHGRCQKDVNWSRCMITRPRNCMKVHVRKRHHHQLLLLAGSRGISDKNVGECNPRAGRLNFASIRWVIGLRYRGIICYTGKYLRAYFSNRSTSGQYFEFSKTPNFRTEP